MSKKVEVKMVIEIPDIEHSPEELIDWLRWELNDNGSLHQLNPFFKESIQIGNVKSFETTMIKE